VRFWSYLLGALRTVEPGLGAAALTALPTAGRALADVVVAPLLNDLTALSRRLVVVLDDYHLVRQAIASRADPPLPLGGMRAAGEVLELRAAELGFSYAEAEALLNGSLALGLERQDVERLQTRTEGWAAARGDGYVGH